MEAILKVISFFIALLAVVNGAYVIYMPPEGDTPAGLVIISAGIAIFAGVLVISRIQDQKRGG